MFCRLAELVSFNHMSEFKIEATDNYTTRTNFLFISWILTYGFFFLVYSRIFKNTALAVQESEQLLHASVLSMVEFDDDIFAAGNCFDWNQHPQKKGLFCPFAFRLPYPNHGSSLAKDLAAEYHYLGNTSEWFFLARKNAERVIAKNEQYIKGSLIVVIVFMLITNTIN